MSKRELSENSIHIAAQCWCDKETEMIEFDHRLATAFATRYDDLQRRFDELEKRCNGLFDQNIEWIAQTSELLKHADAMYSGKMISEMHDGTNHEIDKAMSNFARFRATLGELK